MIALELRYNFTISRKDTEEKYSPLKLFIERPCHLPGPVGMLMFYTRTKKKYVAVWLNISCKGKARASRGSTTLLKGGPSR